MELTYWNGKGDLQSQLNALDNFFTVHDNVERELQEFKGNVCFFYYDLYNNGWCNSSPDSAKTILNHFRDLAGVEVDLTNSVEYLALLKEQSNAPMVEEEDEIEVEDDDGNITTEYITNYYEPDILPDYKPYNHQPIIDEMESLATQMTLYVYNELARRGYAV